MRPRAAGRRHRKRRQSTDNDASIDHVETPLVGHRTDLSSNRGGATIASALRVASRRELIPLSCPTVGGRTNNNGYQGWTQGHRGGLEEALELGRWGKDDQIGTLNHITP